MSYNRLSLKAAALSVATAVGAGSWVLPTKAARAEAQEKPAPREIEIVVDGGYKPSSITIAAGEAVRLKIVRKEYSSCTRELVFPGLSIRKELPPNKPVFIDLPALAAGEYEFRCGMNMVRGKLVVQAS